MVNQSHSPVYHMKQWFLLTKFEWPRDEPIEVVGNGYMYNRETEEEAGLEQIVRYDIQIKES